MAEDQSPALPNEANIPPTVSITVSKGGKQLDTFQLPEGAILNDLLIACEDHLRGDSNDKEYDWDKAKFIAKGKMLRASEHGDQSITHLHNTKVTLQVPTVEDIQNLHQSSEAARTREARRQAAHLRSAARTSKATSRRRDPSDGEYTFQRVEPLPGFTNAERSRAFLLRLKEDPGIRAAMRKHKFSVGLLTEMDPASNTQSSHEGTTRLLGLNRNRGEAIELRLRTDAYDGYRDYKTIRNTLCHELAHNVFGPHDRDFWDLCHQIEREVQAADWKSGGHTVAEGEFYQSPEDDVPDHGGWSGGTYVLGGAGNGGSSGTQGLTRRDIIARATEERLRKKQQAEDPDERGSGADGGS
ncbi:hypothetical protein VM1G_11933 [Cytospora mali]|uniref:WLM domain-containing protein n=1 Tax=Cytospora mali TaxID=578113 RepID=A0A194WBQ4_CYTMA|nr:hypothetical protein VM1G_11933 [Valsa mali]